MLRSSLPLTPAVTQAIADFVKAHPQDCASVRAPAQGPVVQAQKANQCTGSRNSWGWAHSNPPQFLVGCNVQGTLASHPPAQPICAKVLAGFVRSDLQDNLCTVLEACVRAQVSFGNLGFRDEARALVEQGGSFTRSGWKVQWQKSYKQPWAPFTAHERGAPVAGRFPVGRPSSLLAVGVLLPSPRPRHTRMRTEMLTWHKNISAANTHARKSVGGHVPLSWEH